MHNSRLPLVAAGFLAVAATACTETVTAVKVNGTVVNEADNTGIPNADVSIVDTTYKTVTDSQGRFSLTLSSKPSNQVTLYVDAEQYSEAYRPYQFISNPPPLVIALKKAVSSTITPFPNDGNTTTKNGNTTLLRTPPRAHPDGPVGFAEVADGVSVFGAIAPSSLMTPQGRVLSQLDAVRLDVTLWGAGEANPPVNMRGLTTAGEEVPILSLGAVSIKAYLDHQRLLQVTGAPVAITLRVAAGLADQAPSSWRASADGSGWQAVDDGESAWIEDDGMFELQFSHLGLSSAAVEGRLSPPEAEDMSTSHDNLQ